MNTIKKIYAYVKLTRAIKAADEQFSKTGERQYVVSWGSDLLVIDRPSLKYNKKKRNIPRNKSVLDLEKGAFYYTSYKDGKGAMTPDVQKQRRRYYYKWFCYVFSFTSIWHKTWWYRKLHG